MQPTTNIQQQARVFIEQALQTDGAEALARADHARALVGLDGIEQIVSDLADAGDAETAWFIRGAVDALTNAPVRCPGDGTHDDAWTDGYEWVQLGGYQGAWS